MGNKFKSTFVIIILLIFIYEIHSQVECKIVSRREVGDPLKDLDEEEAKINQAEIAKASEEIGTTTVIKSDEDVAKTDETEAFENLADDVSDDLASSSQTSTLAIELTVNTDQVTPQVLETTKNLVTEETITQKLVTETESTTVALVDDSVQENSLETQTQKQIETITLSSNSNEDIVSTTNIESSNPEETTTPGIQSEKIPINVNSNENFLVANELDTTNQIENINENKTETNILAISSITEDESSTEKSKVVEEITPTLSVLVTTTVLNVQESSTQQELIEPFIATTTHIVTISKEQQRTEAVSSEILTDLIGTTTTVKSTTESIPENQHVPKIIESGKWITPKPFEDDKILEKTKIKANCPDLNCEFGYKTDLLGNALCSCFNPCVENKCGMSKVCQIKKIADDKFLGLCFDPATVERPVKCHLPLTHGNCKNPTLKSYSSRFYFDAFHQTCKHFIFTGCNGNENNFETWERCQMECNTCSQPPIKGPCKASLIRYYYDQINQTCVPFSFGGCRGNENNFSSRKLCEDSCVIKKEGALFLHGMPIEKIKKYYRNGGSKQKNSRVENSNKTRSFF